MSKLSELIPAGGSAKELSAVASGTLPNGRAVILKDNGQVEVVVETPVSASIGSALSIDGPSSNYTRVTMLSATKAIAVYLDAGDTDDGYAVALTISGSSITAGTPVVFNPAGSYYNRIAKISETQAIVVYRDLGNSSYGTACILTLSGSSITAGSEVVFNSGDSRYVVVAVLSATKAIVAYQDNSNSSKSTACILSISGSSITAGSELIFYATDRSRHLSITALTDAKAIVTLEARDATNSPGKACILDVSGTTITAGSVQQFTTGVIYSTSVTALSSTKAIVVYQVSPNAQSRVLDISGTTITAGSALEYRTGTTSYQNIAKLTSTRAIVSYSDNANSSYATYATFTISGATVTLESTVVISNASSAFVDISTGESQQAVVVYKDNGNSGNVTARTIQTAFSSTNLTSTNFVGFASEAISSGATGVINPVGGVAASVSNTLLLQSYGSEVAATSANSYYVNTSYDPNNANRFVVVWAQPGSGGKAVVGTVSGTSITYGSIASFSSSNTGAVSNVAFDSNTANKLVITFQDDGNSGYGTAVVGTLSGTSLSFGSKYVFESANINDPAVGFNPNTANQLVVAYGAGSSGYSRVGTVSGTSISFATRVTFNSLTQYISISFDINTANKFIICYRDRGNANYGKVIVGAISGTSLSYGTEVTFYPNNITQMVAAYDPSQANKVVIIYRNDFASDVGVALVGTVNGTTISYGTAVVFNNASTRSLNLAFQKTGSKFIITYADNGNSSYGTSITGTLSGTNVTFGAENVFNSGSVEYTSISFDENTLGKFVVAYKDTSNSNYPTAISGNLSDNLTIGSTYYVQSDGTVSTVSTSPAVNAGKAISATSLLLKG